MSDFEVALDLILKHEGGFTSDTLDNGNKLPDGRLGSTMLGVTQKNWENFLGKKVTHDDMKALTKSDVAEFYKKNYWDLCKCSQIKVGVSYVVMDLSVNAGVKRAVATAQQAAGCTVDFIMGPRTLGAINDCDSREFIEKFSNAKTEFYKGLVNTKPDQARFLLGWLNRVRDVQNTALKLLD